MAMPDMPMPMMGADDEPSSEPVDEFETEVRSAFPKEDWTPERVMAFKEAIKLCLESDQAGDYGDRPPPKKGGSGLALIFEGPKKKEK